MDTCKLMSFIFSYRNFLTHKDKLDLRVQLINKTEQNLIVVNQKTEVGLIKYQL